MVLLPVAVLHATWNVAVKMAGADHRCAFIGAAMIAGSWAQVAQVAPMRELSMLPAAPAPA